MIKLTFDVDFMAALRTRVAQYLQATDADILARIAGHDDPSKPIATPADELLYEQALTITLCEALCNLLAASQIVFGEHAEARLDAMVAEALRRAKDAQGQADAKRKAGSS